MFELLAQTAGEETPATATEPAKHTPTQVTSFIMFLPLIQRPACTPAVKQAQSHHTDNHLSFRTHFSAFIPT